MTAEVTCSSCTKDFNVFKTSADNSSELNLRSMNLLSYSKSLPIVRLNSTKVLEASLVNDFVALLLSLLRVMYALSPTFIPFFLLKDTQDGIVSFNVSLFFIVGSPFSILHIAEFVVPKSIP